MMRSIEHEKAMIKTFVVRDMQKEFLSFLTRPEDRWKFTRELATFPWFEMRFAKPVQWRVNPSLSEFGQTLSGISNVSFMLRSKGAGDTCWVISGNPQIDAHEIELTAAIGYAIESDSGTILSCIPGKLAYFKGKNASLLFTR
jgi:hypothetical protein